MGIVAGLGATGAAILGAGVVGAGASLAGSLISSNAAKSAGNQQVALQNQALGIEQKQFQVGDTALNPYITAGQSVLPTVNALQNPNSPQTVAQTLYNLPGFQFASGWGTKATENALSAEGLGGSTGPLAYGISQFNEGLASTNYNQYISQLLGTAGLGSSAASSLAGNANQSAALQGGTLTNAGNAAAAGTLGSANAVAGGLTGATSSLNNAILMNSLLSGGGIYGGSSGLTNSDFNGLTDAQILGA